MCETCQFVHYIGCLVTCSFHEVGEKINGLCSKFARRELILSCHIRWAFGGIITAQLLEVNLSDYKI